MLTMNKAIDHQDNNFVISAASSRIARSEGFVRRINKMITSKNYEENLKNLKKALIVYIKCDHYSFTL